MQFKTSAQRGRPQETDEVQKSLQNPAGNWNFRSVITLMPQCVVALILDLPVPNCGDTNCLNRANNSGRPRRPRARFPAARVAEGVLGPFFDCKVFRRLKRPTTKSDDSCRAA